MHYHPGFQQIAFVDIETGDGGEQRLLHREEAEKFYRDLVEQGKAVRVGMEASGFYRQCSGRETIRRIGKELAGAFLRGSLR